MARAENTEIIDSFEEFYRTYYRNEIGELARKYPNDQRSLYISWGDLYRYDQSLAEDVRTQPDQYREYAEEALRLYDLPVDVSLGQAHVRIYDLSETTEIRDIRAHHAGQLVSLRGIIRKATNVRPKVQDAAFECQRCGSLTRVPQTGSDFHPPHECQGCERQGPFRINFDQSEFVDAQKLRVQESPEGLRGGERPQNIDVHIEDDITGEVTAGDTVRVTGILHLDQQESQGEKSTMFDIYMDGVTIEVEDDRFEDMDITEEDKKQIIALSDEDDIYERMISSMAPSIYGYDDEKLAIILQLFSGVTKNLPDGSRIRGDMHILLIGDPGTGKCVKGDTKVTLADESEVPIRDLVESNLDDPKRVDDGFCDEIDIEVPSMESDGSLGIRRATKVWKREAPDQMYRIRTTSGKEIEVTPSHPLFVQSGGTLTATKAENLSEDQFIAIPRKIPSEESPVKCDVVYDGGQVAPNQIRGFRADSDISWDRIDSIEVIDSDDTWVYDLEVEGTHNYLTNHIVSHNSQLLQYVRNIAPRSVYTAGKGSSAAGLTAAAVRDDFSDGQQWSLEAGALVLADQGVAAVDELDKMRCVTGETLVQTAEKGAVPIYKLTHDTANHVDSDIEQHENGRTIRTDEEIGVWTMTDNDRIVPRSVTAVHEYDAPERLHEVTLESGETLTTTTDHPFFVVENGERIEKPAIDLTVDDRVFVPERAACDGGTSIGSNLSEHRPSDVRDVSYRTVEHTRIIDDHAHEAVYDLTVEGTHNFIANGMVVHNSEDRSAMHEALEQQEISVSKAGINATLKSRCSLLGAANPKYGRFDEFESIAGQIDLEPALVSRFDIIFTVTDKPDPDKDKNLAQHIINTNYAGELHTHRTETSTSNVSQKEVTNVTDDVEPSIDADLLRKYIAYAKRSCYPMMTEEAKGAIEDFYVDLRSQGTDSDSPVPVTARKLEALVRLAEASARVRLSDTVEQEDVDRILEIVTASLEDIGMDPETGEFDADVVETGTSKTQRDRIRNIKGIITEIEDEYDKGAPVEEVIDRAETIGMDQSKAEHEIKKLREQGDVYEPQNGHLRTV
jgi:DNA replicative helicase MCM subunit Mcm2 (Cdc46/Mcm family)